MSNLAAERKMNMEEHLDDALCVHHVQLSGLLLLCYRRGNDIVGGGESSSGDTGAVEGDDSIKI